jgi:hypothetical protein
MKSPQVILCFFASVVLFGHVRAQNAGVNFSGAAPNASAAFDVDVSALAGQKKGILVPRVTLAQLTAMNPLPAAAQGMLVYQTDALQGFYYNVSNTTVPFWTMLVNKEALRWDLLIKPIADLTMAHGAFTTSFSFNGVTTADAFSLLSTTLTSGSLLDLFSNSTAGIGGAMSKVLNIRRAGVNANLNHEAVGVYSYVSNSGGVSSNYGGYFLAGGASQNYGVYGRVLSKGAGVYGVNSSTETGLHYGVYGVKDGATTLSTGIGVYGKGAGLSLTNYGGYFESFDASGSGYGVRGKASGGTGTHYGGYFEAEDGLGNYGVYATTNNGKGVLGTSANGDGVYGRASYAGSGVHGVKDGDFTGLAGYGVHGEATGAGLLNVGGYFSASGATSNLAISVPVNGKVALGTGSDLSANAILGLKNGHVHSLQTTKPTIAALANLGTGAGATVSDNSSDVAGSFVLSSGSASLAQGQQATITFNETYDRAPRVVITASNRNAALMGVFVGATVTGFTINFTTAATASLAHAFNYIVIEN